MEREEERERIFEPYQRAHDVVSQPASVGLGLTISRQLARIMGGDLAYRWTGEESCFEFSLPAAVTPTSKREAEETVVVAG